MREGPFGLMWWQVNTVANAIVGLAVLFMVVRVVLHLARLGQLRTNRLAQGAVAVFLLLGLQRVLQVAYQVVNLLGPDAAAFAARQRNVWWMTVLQVVLAGVALYFTIYRKAWGRLVLQAVLFDSFAQKQRLEALEAEQELLRARAAAERDRDANAAMLQSVIQNSKSMITVKDLEGRFLLVNQAFHEGYGTVGTDLTGKTLDDVPANLNYNWREVDRKAEHRMVEFELSMPGDDGERRYEVLKLPLRDGGGEVYATCTIATDVTERQRVAELMREARDAALAANAAKSAFLATMSHEIRTPMNAVIGMTDLLLGTDLDDLQREFVDTVRASGDALMAVINDILDFSKIEAGELRLDAELFSMRDEVENCLDFVVAAASAKGLDLVCYVDDTCPAQVRGDVVRIRQILANLLSNAVKFTERGDVLLTVTSAPADDGKAELTITVTDTGIGIEEAGIDRLFKSFSQVDASTTRIHGGTGLGLAISLRLASAMGGTISASSTPGVGSTFTCTLVVEVGPDSPPSHAGCHAAVSSLIGTSVLLVDDNLTNLRILDLQLSELGMRCTTADSPHEALALAADGLRYDVALIDMDMPRMDGIQLGAELRRLPGLEHTPLALLTSFGSRPPGSERDFAACLAKPAKSRAVRDLLVSLLEHGEADPPAAPGQDRDAIPARSTLRVLLAEDNPVNQRVAELMLDRLGYAVTTVSTGREAVDAVQESRYDVVLMDVQMPEMDGLEATRQIVSALPGETRPYIVAMTASALVQDRDACAAAGMDNYLSKPVRARDLATLLAEVPAVSV